MPPSAILAYDASGCAPKPRPTIPAHLPACKRDSLMKELEATHCHLEIGLLLELSQCSATRTGVWMALSASLIGRGGGTLCQSPSFADATCATYACARILWGP